MPSGSLRCTVGVGSRRRELSGGPWRCSIGRIDRDGDKRCRCYGQAVEPEMLPDVAVTVIEPVATAWRGLGARCIADRRTAVLRAPGHRSCQVLRCRPSRIPSR